MLCAEALSTNIYTTCCNAWFSLPVQDPNPSIATLLPDAASGGAAGMAQRLGEQQPTGLEAK